MKIKNVLESQLKESKKISLDISKKHEIIFLLRQKTATLNEISAKRLNSKLRLFKKSKKIGILTKVTITKLFVVLGCFAAISAATATTFVITQKDPGTNVNSIIKNTNNNINNSNQPDIYNDWNTYTNDSENSFQIKFKYPKEWVVNTIQDTTVKCDNAFKALLKDNNCNGVPVPNILIRDSNNNSVTITTNLLLKDNNKCLNNTCSIQSEKLNIVNKTYDLKYYSNESSNGNIIGFVNDDIESSPLSIFNKYNVVLIKALNSDNLITIKNILKSIQYLPGNYIINPYKDWNSNYTSTYDISFFTPSNWSSEVSLQNINCSNVISILKIGCVTNIDFPKITISKNLENVNSDKNIDKIILGPLITSSLACEKDQGCVVQDLELKINNITQVLKISYEKETNTYNTLGYIPNFINVGPLSDWKSLYINIVSTSNPNLDQVSKILNSIRPSKNIDNDSHDLPTIKSTPPIYDPINTTTPTITTSVTINKKS